MKERTKPDVFSSPVGKPVTFVLELPLTQIPGISSNTFEPEGIVPLFLNTPRQSQLGVIRYRTSYNSGSLDDLAESGTWHVVFGPNVTGGPEGISSGQAILEVVRLGTAAPHFFQRLTIERNGKIYTRCKKPTEEGFFPWSE